MASKRKVTTEIGRTTVEHIYVRGRDLAAELLGKIDFVDMLLLIHSGRTCADHERVLLNAILVGVMDHGLTPSSIAARLTLMGAPEAPQAAVAAGLLGAGSVFLGAMENAAQMLAAGVAALPQDASDEALRARADEMVAAARRERRMIFGLGHPIHVRGDPRVATLRELSRANRAYGRHWRLMEALEAAQRDAARKPLPINAGGAIAAIVCDLGLPLDLARGLALVGRSAGLIGHLQEERTNPIGAALWDLALRQDDRNVLPD